VLGKELRRLKLKRMDLARADLRLGEKAYATGMAEGQAELVSKLDRVAQRLTELRQQRIQAAPTLGEKAKLLASRIGKAIQIGALKLRRRRILRQLGAKLRQSGANSSLREETRWASAVAERIGSLDAELRELAPQTYLWARRPLLLICLLLLLAMIAGAFGVRHQFKASLAQQKKPDRSSLSDAQMKKMLAQQQSFQQQMQQMVAEATRREAEQRQARIAAAERQYREQRERERAEVEKRQREEAQERERLAAAERAHQDAQQREEERRVAEEKARQEQQQREAEAQREKKRQEAAALLVAGLTAPGLGAEPVRGDSTGHVNKGVELTQKEQYDAAIAEFNAAIEVDPKNADAYRGRAAANRGLKKYNEAIADYSRSLEDQGRCRHVRKARIYLCDVFA
jgi:tetratricopeptide (TPR) repeat protein